MKLRSAVVKGGSGSLRGTLCPSLILSLQIRNVTVICSSYLLGKDLLFSSVYRIKRDNYIYSELNL